MSKCTLSVKQALTAFQLRASVSMKSDVTTSTTA